MTTKEKCKLIVLALMIWCRTAVKGDMEQQSCSNLDPMSSSSFLITTRYAPSLITCSFICKDTPNCRRYSYLNKQCALYWTSTTWEPSEKGLLTCSSTGKACPKTINNGQYSCFLFAEQDRCYCMSSASMGRGAANDSCNLYGMKLISLETSEENMFIRNIIKTNPVNGWCVWTSALRTGYLQFIWNSTGQMTNLDINRSLYLDDKGGNCLMYNKGTTPEPWLWDDWHCSSMCVSMCEFTPLP